PLPECSEPLMAQHANRFLTVASGLAVGRQEQISKLRARLTPLTLTAVSGVEIDAASVTPVSPNDHLSTSVQVRPTASRAGYPNGQARVAVQVLGNPIPRMAAACPMASLRNGQVFDAELPLDAQLVQSSFHDVSRPLLAEFWFRGNSRRSSFRIVPAGGRVTEVSINPSAATTFTVQSQRLRGAAITFVLDCSASMQELLARESEPGQTRKHTAAIAALQGLLSELTDQSEANIGVMLYGHRASHDAASQKTLIQQRYAERFTVPSGLQPYADVESILPPGRFGAAELGMVAARLERLLPWGETPLYLAVTRAAADFQQLPADVPRHLVVITDGRNYQFNPPAAQRVDFTDALHSAQAANVMVHVIGFAMSAEDQQSAGDEFGTLAAQTGGTSHLVVSRASDLVRTLRALVGPATFQWTTQDGRVQESPVNEPVVWKGPLPGRINVMYGTSTSEIALRGGEAAVLLGDAAIGATDTLESADYTAHNPQVVPLVGGGSGSPPIVVGIHQPRRAGLDADFEFSLQRADRLFLTRPVGYDVVIQPLDAAGVAIGLPYRDSGREFAPRMPVPVVQLQATGWPAEASQADIRFTMIAADAAAPERISLPLASVAAPAVPLRSIPGVQWEIRQTTEYVQCVLRHLADSPGMGKLCVDFQSGPSFKSVQRRIDSDARIEVHTFVYTESQPENAAATIEFALPSPNARWEMSRPWRVRLASEEGLIAPTRQGQAAAVGPVILR
ncbi:MAG: VWA domain-containing protein, partial [Planctomycetaceae bacterium]|nr:VWA domain-containing protein [Planctomycetaceae bacterium]